MKNRMQILLPFVLMLAMVFAVRYDAAIISPHSGGELSLIVAGLAFLIAIVLGIRAARKRRWFRAAAMAVTLVCVFVCDHWLWKQVPPCTDCEPAEYAEWLERTDES